MNTQNSSLLHFLSSCWEERNRMKTELTALAKQRETTCHERERADTDLEFSFWFSVVVLMYLFAGFVSTSVCQV